MSTPDPQAVVIRPGKATDAGNLVRLITEAYTDKVRPFPEANPHRCLLWVTEVLTSGYVLVAEKSRRMVGSIAVVNHRFPWSEVPFIRVEWFCVVGKFRRGATADGLVKALHLFADKNGAPITGTVHSVEDAALLDRLAKMKGYTYTGGAFIRAPAGES
jgi:hypothetical protein